MLQWVVLVVEKQWASWVVVEKEEDLGQNVEGKVDRWSL